MTLNRGGKRRRSFCIVPPSCLKKHVSASMELCKIEIEIFLSEAATYLKAARWWRWETKIRRKSKGGLGREQYILAAQLFGGVDDLHRESLMFLGFMFWRLRRVPIENSYQISQLGGQMNRRWDGWM